MTDINKKLEALEARILNEKEILRLLMKIAKEEAMRSLKMKEVLKFEKNQEEKLQKAFGLHEEEVYQDYSKLLSQQVCQKLNSYVNQLDELKRHLPRVNKNNNAADVESDIIKDSENLEKIVEQAQNFWRESSFLMANYRLDITARELERWSNGLAHETDDDTKKIENLFG